MIASEQLLDDNLKSALTNSSLNLRLISIPNCVKKIYCHISKDSIRPFIPKTLRRKFFKSFHNLSHPSMRASVRLVKSKGVWPSINKDCRD